MWDRMGDVLGRQVVVTASRDRDIVSLSKLQKRYHDGVNFVVHNEAPHLWLDQESEQKICYRVSNGAFRGQKPGIALFRKPGGGTG